MGDPNNARRNRLRHGGGRGEGSINKRGWNECLKGACTGVDVSWSTPPSPRARIFKHQLLCMVSLLLPRPALDSNSTALNLHDCSHYLVNSHSCILFCFPPISSFIFVFCFRGGRSEAALSAAFPLTFSFVTWRGVEERDRERRGRLAGMRWKRKRGRWGRQ